MWAQVWTSEWAEVTSVDTGVNAVSAGVNAASAGVNAVSAGANAVRAGVNAVSADANVLSAGANAVRSISRASLSDAVTTDGQGVNGGASRVCTYRERCEQRCEHMSEQMCEIQSRARLFGDVRSRLLCGTGVNW